MDSGLAYLFYSQAQYEMMSKSKDQHYPCLGVLKDGTIVEYTEMDKVNMPSTNFTDFRHVGRGYFLMRAKSRDVANKLIGKNISEIQESYIVANKV